MEEEEKDLFPNFEKLHITPATRSAAENRLDRSIARSVQNEMAREALWEREVMRELDRKISNGKIHPEKRDYFLRVFFLGKTVGV